MKNKLFPGIELEVACLPDSENSIANLFWNCLEDYIVRFNTPIIMHPIKIQICAVEYSLEGNGDMGLTMFNDDDGRILVQVRDPFLNECEYTEYAMSLFINIICHEIVHVCQHLTGRTGFKIPKMNIGEDIREEYFFDPEEIEARVLEAPYTAYYGSNIT